MITLPGAVPAIISEEEFNKVQEVMDGRKKTGPRQKGEELYFLTGLVVCGICGAAMVGNSSRRKAGADPVRYYECNRKMRTRKCRSKRIRKDYLENYVLDVVEQDIFAPEKLPVLARMMLARARERDKEIIQEEEHVRAELAQIETKIENLIAAIEDGSIDFQLLGDRIKVLKKRKDDLQEYLASKSSTLSKMTEEMVIAYLSATQKKGIDRSNFLAKKKTVDLHVHEIKAFPDKTEVLLKLNLGADKDGVGGGT